ncbi:MAG: TetR/AcrR family transcriptional regulator [Alkaliphilus sp.]
MAGLREQKKEKSREEIIKAAKEVFFQHGYDKTTIAMISKRAGIGVGTIYNYFYSKAELYIQVMSDVFQVPFIQTRLIVSTEKETASQIILKFFNSYLILFANVKKEIIRETFAVFFGNTTDRKSIRNKLIQWDYEAIKTFKNIILSLVEKEKLPAYFRVDESAHILFSVFCISLMIYVYDDTDLVEVQASLKKQIDFIFRANNRNN